MRNATFGLLLLVCVGALHAYASQEAQLREFIRSRRNSSNANSTGEPRVGSTTTTSSFREYSVYDLANLKAADKIHVLPGQPGGTVGLNQYGGYVTVDERNGRALFYYFVEAASDAAAKPLLLWLNGGPGCSSLGFGAMMELGPFRVNKDKRTLSENLQAWTKVANVIFLESPVGVGFSYSNTTTDYYQSGDQRTADDAFVFLVNWLERFPEYKGRPFYISGESYGGHYVPQLAAAILGHNLENSSTRSLINLRGILVGNPYLDANMNAKGKIDYLWSHGMLSDEVWASITKKCNLDQRGYKACVDDMQDADQANIDPYDIYGSVCLELEGPTETQYPSRYIPRSYDICSDRYVHVYLNDPRVQKALHARPTEWTQCSDGKIVWIDAPASMVPTLKWLIEHRLPVWLYSGDFDSVCPFTATRYTIHDLGLNVTEPWRPWIVEEIDEVGGYVQGYTGGLVFATVRAAGHTVPSYEPEGALVLASSFLNGTLPRRHQAL